MQLQEQAIVITVSSAHVIVARKRPRADGSIIYECAQNAADLELEAMLALARQEQPFGTGHEFPCPPDLAARARWN